MIYNIQHAIYNMYGIIRYSIFYNC